MRPRRALPLAGFLLAATAPGHAQGRAQSSAMTVPQTIAAGDAFSIPLTGSGKATLYIVGPAQVLKREVQRGETTAFAAGTLYNAGHYQVILIAAPAAGAAPAASGGAAAPAGGPAAIDTGAIDVLPAAHPAALNLLAKPSRLPVGLHDGISGAVYVFDAYQNLITAPTSVSFELSNGPGATQTRTVSTRAGAAWTQMDSTRKEGAAKFVARIGSISSTRVIEQVPGDPCSLRVSARQAGQKVQLETEPVRDCSGNAVPDGTIVTFTETYNGTQATVDVPLKRGIAQVEMPAHSGAKISVASGVVLGNEIRL